MAEGYSVADLKLDRGFWYVGSPYTNFGPGIDEAAFQVAVICAKLVRAGLCVFSPIVHSHTIADCGEIDPLDHEFWLTVDKPFVDAAYGMIIADMPGWNSSKGVAKEARWFGDAGKSVFLFKPETMAVEKLR